MDRDIFTVYFLILVLFVAVVLLALLLYQTREDLIETRRELISLQNQVYDRTRSQMTINGRLLRWVDMVNLKLGFSTLATPTLHNPKGVKDAREQ